MGRARHGGRDEPAAGPREPLLRQGRVHEGAPGAAGAGGLREGLLRMGVAGSLRERAARSLGRDFTAPPRPFPAGGCGARRGEAPDTDRGMREAAGSR